jgi:hypothetical protein
MVRRGQWVLAVAALAGLALPATAGERAVLRVSARVVERCTVELPAAVPRERMPVDPAALMGRGCGGAAPGVGSGARPQGPGPDAVTTRRRGDQVLVTLTF